MIYRLIRKLLFFIPPEEAHSFVMFILKIIFKIKLIRKLIFNYCKKHNSSLKISKLIFNNRCGLAAGFDKNAKYLYELATFGFSYIEIGTITPGPQKGNPKPRLFRLVKDEALINRMGLNNDGVDIIYKRILKFKNKYPNEKIILGANIGKNKDTLPENGYLDILKCFNKLYDVVDYFTINVSCPNVKNNTELQDPIILNDLLNKINKERITKIVYKPIFVKISPDLSISQIDEILNIIISNNIDGIIVSNTTTDYSNLKTSKNKIEKISWGGLSGRPLKIKSDEILKYINNKYKNRNFVMIASGGIITPDDALDKIKYGADLIQLYTGFIYSGPFIVRKINEKLYKFSNN